MGGVLSFLLFRAERLAQDRCCQNDWQTLCFLCHVELTYFSLISLSAKWKVIWPDRIQYAVFMEIAAFSQSAKIIWVKVVTAKGMKYNRTSNWPKWRRGRGNRKKGFRETYAVFSVNVFGFEIVAYSYKLLLFPTSWTEEIQSQSISSVITNWYFPLSTFFVSC